MRSSSNKRWPLGEPRINPGEQRHIEPWFAVSAAWMASIFYSQIQLPAGPRRTRRCTCDKRERGDLVRGQQRPTGWECGREFRTCRVPLDQQGENHVRPHGPRVEVNRLTTTCPEPAAICPKGFSIAEAIINPHAYIKHARLQGRCWPVATHVNNLGLQLANRLLCIGRRVQTGVDFESRVQHHMGPNR